MQGIKATSVKTSIQICVYVTRMIICVHLMPCRESIHILVRYRAIFVHSRPRFLERNGFRGDGQELGKASSV